MRHLVFDAQIVADFKETSIRARKETMDLIVQAINKVLQERENDVASAQINKPRKPHVISIEM